MFKLIWNWFLSIVDFNGKSSNTSIEERLDRIERFQSLIVLFVFLFGTAFTFLIMGMILMQGNDPLLGKVFLGIGFGFVLLGALGQFGKLR